MPSGLVTWVMTLVPPVPPDTDDDASAKSPNGNDSPTRKPVFFWPPMVVKAVAKKEAWCGKPNDKVAVTVFELVPSASVLWMKLALRLALSKGSGTPAEIRLSALGGCALVRNDAAAALTDEESFWYALMPNGSVDVCCKFAVTDARSLNEPNAICELALIS